MKLVSWNVNGLRAVMNKGFMDYFNKVDADIFALQEIKLSEGQIEMDIPGYYEYWNYAVKKGYSGTAIFTKIKPMNVYYGIGKEEHDSEGRVITLEFKDSYFVVVYTPNAKRELARLEYRMVWEDEFRNYLNRLDEHKPVILCGDLNVAHKEIDLKNPQSNKQKPGFSIEERKKFGDLLESGFVDSFRYFYPDLEEAYTWWSYITKARSRNAGWRIDYFIVSDKIKDRMVDAQIHSDILGSDHCPVYLEIK